MDSVQIEQKSYEMPPRDGISIAHFLTVKHIERSARYYEKVFGVASLAALVAHIDTTTTCEKGGFYASEAGADPH
jgi:hypothetical protein